MRKGRTMRTCLKELLAQDTQGASSHLHSKTSASFTIFAPGVVRIA
jgi:hypothetical protein